MKKLVLLSLLLSVFSVFAVENAVAENQPPYSLDLHYTELSPAYETDSKDKVIVYEFFGYKCPHCSSFQAYMEPWNKKLPKHIKLVRIPVVFQPGWDILAKAYYTVETMGIADKTHKAMFDAIHQQRKRFRNMDEIADWYADNFKVDKKAFLATADSFMIDSKIRQSNNLMKKMKITSTPSIVINGKFKPIPKALGSQNGVLELATYLANEEANRMGLVK